MNNYQKVINYINKNYKGQKKKMLTRYFNSEMFEKDLDNIMNYQNIAGECITKQFATECTLESFMQNEEDY